MASLEQMYEEERSNWSVRESIRRVAERTGNAPASVARRLGFNPGCLPPGPALAGPLPVSVEGRCNACNDRGDGRVLAVGARSMTLRLCPGCARDLRDQLAITLARI